MLYCSLSDSLKGKLIDMKIYPYWPWRVALSQYLLLSSMYTLSALYPYPLLCSYASSNVSTMHVRYMLRTGFSMQILSCSQIVTMRKSRKDMQLMAFTISWYKWLGKSKYISRIVYLCYIIMTDFLMRVQPCTSFFTRHRNTKDIEQTVFMLHQK